MNTVEELFERLKERYDGAIPFKQICQDEGIIIAKAPLDEGVNGLYLSSGGHKAIILNEALSYWERRDWAYHELWHYFCSPSPGGSYHNNKKEEHKANLFAALCRVQRVKEDDTIESLQERYNISPWLAKLRIEYELKKMNQ